MKNINDKLKKLDRQGILMPIATLFAVAFAIASLFEVWFIVGLAGCGLFGIYMFFLWDNDIYKSGDEDVR